MLTVHHLNNSRSQRILWLLEELEVDYDLVKYRRHPKTMLAPPKLRQIHPLGKSPVVTHDDNTLAESGAIIAYIIDEFGAARLRPEPGTPQFLRYRYWMHYAEGSAMTPLLLKLVFSRLPGESPFLVRPLVGLISRMVQTEYVDPQIALHMDYWEEELSQNDYFAGEEFTAADIQMSFALEASLVRGGGDAYPKIRALVGEFRQRPAYKRALERGGQFSLAM